MYQNCIVQPDENGVWINNQNLFVSTDNYSMEYRVFRDGELIFSGNDSAEVQPQSKKYKNIDYPEFKEEGEYLYRISLCLSENTSWENKGYEVAYGEFIVKKSSGNKKPVETSSTKDLRFVKGDGNVGFHTDHTSVLFSVAEGGIASYKIDGVEYIKRSAKPIYWRASTDNDRGNNDVFLGSQWSMASKFQKLIDFTVDKIEECYQLVYTFMTPTTPTTTSKVTYTVDLNCNISVKMHYFGQKGLVMLPLYGMEFQMIPELKYFSWYGLGPDENYIDRAAGAKLGKYEKNVRDNLSKYIVPQECGNRTGVRSAKVYDEAGRGIEFTAMNAPFEFNALPYSTSSLENALHIEELPPITSTFVRIVGKQMGVGGDDSWGAPVQPEYCISGEEDIEFEFMISSIHE